MKLMLTLLAVTWTVFARPAPADEPATTIDALQLSDQTWLLRTNSKIGNPPTVVVLAGDEAVLVDASLLEATPLIDEWLRAHGAQRVRYVATTHYHADHTQGLEHYAQAGATVIATPGQRELLRTKGLLSEDGPPLKPYALPTLLVDGRLSLPLGDETLTLFTTSVAHSHTSGDLFARLEHANVLFGGDHLFADHFPVIDYDGGGSLRGYLDNVQTVIDMADGATRIVAGHGTFAPAPLRTYDRAYLAAWRDSLVQSIAAVRALHDRGLTLEQAQSEGLPAAFASMSERPRFVSEAAWITTVYHALDIGEYQ
jgi:cyclase